jgi:hypothetical protein
MIYTDGTHVISDISLDELHAFAKLIGFKKEWFQDNKKYQHYDLTTKRAYIRAIKAGAKKITSKEIIKILKKGIKYGTL